MGGIYILKTDYGKYLVKVSNENLKNKIGIKND